ncbi:MAG TPA: prephenate dehydratase [Thermoleophilaceae bacterium]|nr:prephenate dehydratase [Thermoleophilaceae bacterium]
MRFAFLGPRGTHSEEAVRALAPGGVEAVPHQTVRDAIMAVRGGAADRAVVPIENSLEGSVAATLDTLAVDAPEVRIFAERTLAIRQSLIVGRPLELGAIERVVSHPQALAQCARFLRNRLPGAEQAAAASTAEGVRQVVAGDAPWAALGSRLAAEEYGATVLSEGVEDRPDNVTRFVALARIDEAGYEAPAEAGPAKTSIVFFGFNDVSPGALVAVLEELSSRDINLTKIESRPRRVGLGHYMFFADLEGGEGEPHVAEALAALAGRVETLHVLGSYPSVAADEPPR